VNEVVAGGCWLLVGKTRMTRIITTLLAFLICTSASRKIITSHFSLPPDRPPVPPPSNTWSLVAWLKRQVTGTADFYIALIFMLKLKI